MEGPDLSFQGRPFTVGDHFRVGNEHHIGPFDLFPGFPQRAPREQPPRPKRLSGRNQQNIDLPFESEVLKPVIQHRQFRPPALPGQHPGLVAVFPDHHGDPRQLSGQPIGLFPPLLQRADYFFRAGDDRPRFAFLSAVAPAENNHFFSPPPEMIGDQGGMGGLAGSPGHQIPKADDGQGQSAYRQQPQPVQGQAQNNA